MRILNFSYTLNLAVIMHIVSVDKSIPNIDGARGADKRWPMAKV